MEQSMSDFEYILETYNPGDIAFLKSLLDAEDITYFFQGEHFSYVKQMAIPVRLMVSKDEAEEVRELIKDVKISFVVGSIPDEQEEEESKDEK